MRKWTVVLFILIMGLVEGKITFERAGLDQLEFLTDLGLRANGVYHYRCVSDEIARAVFLVEDWHINDGIVRVMKEDAEIIGFYGLVRDKEINILSHFFLEPMYIGKGYGKILFIEAMRAAKEELIWESLQWESDPNAAWFYRKMGAVQIGENACPLNPQYNAPVFLYRL